MITGVVTETRQAVVNLVVCSSLDDRTSKIEAVVDTGYNGFLTLPPETVEELALPKLGTVFATLGDGSKMGMACFLATVLWGSDERDVVVLQAGQASLLGMGMLLGHRLSVDVENDGFVRIEPLLTNHAAAPC